MKSHVLQTLWCNISGACVCDFYVRRNIQNRIMILIVLDLIVVNAARGPFACLFSWNLTNKR